MYGVHGLRRCCTGCLTLAQLHCPAKPLSSNLMYSTRGQYGLSSSEPARRGWGGRGGRGGRGRGRGHPHADAGMSTSGETSSQVARAATQERSPQPRLTHFLALPIGHHAALRERIVAFTDALLNGKPAIPGLDASIIIPARRLHFTLGVMSLGTEATDGVGRPRTLEAATALLHELRPRVMEMLGRRRLSVALTRMDIMKPERRDLARAHVMWVGPAQEEENVRIGAEFVHGAFKRAGLVVDENRPLKVGFHCTPSYAPNKHRLQLHCTVVNTTYRRPRGKGRQPFSYEAVLGSSALGAVERTATQSTVAVDFGEWAIDEIEICEMGSWGAEGEYVCVGRCGLGGVPA
ncbi:AKAP7 2'5' RNA ligase-like domain-containing protein [Amylocystis lapponica]|nr:AKAP7 2'5' RNA ligase-like domain-containing protein [Amylocystis lapponica]